MRQRCACGAKKRLGKVLFEGKTMFLFQAEAVPYKGQFPTHTLYPFPTHPHHLNKARYPPIAHIKE
ncbi:hypothetical protein GSU75_05387 [Pseudomonas savastanoi pv. phaseolicola]|nr:hypothetical protein [Pseudomonas savastanoi pv. phaseolicola]MBN4178891.1 hypothetical protein [Pseudomonas savastanoi pv. phaseolicola]